MSPAGAYSTLPTAPLELAPGRMPGVAAFRTTANAPLMSLALLMLITAEVIVLGASFVLPGGYNPGLCVAIAGACVGVIVAYYVMLLGRHERAVAIAPDVLMVCMVALFHIPTVFFGALGQIRLTAWWWWNYTAVNQAMLLTLSAILSYLIGYNIYARPAVFYTSKPRNPADYSRAWLYVGQGVFVVGLLFHLYFMVTQVSLPELLTSRYGFKKFAAGLADERPWFTGMLFCRAGIVIMSAFSAALYNTPMKGWLSRIAIALYLLLIFVTGHRNQIVFCVIPIVFCYCFLCRRIRLPVLIGLGLAGAIAMSAALIVRRMGDKSIARVQEAFEAQSQNIGLLQSAQEAGGTMTTVFRTVAVVPARDRFRYGMSLVDGLLRVVPNVSGETGGVFARESPSQWLTRTTAPRSYRQSVGLAYSIVAEAYLNWGYLGPPILLGGLGFLTRRLFDRAFYNRNPFRMVLAMIWIATLANWVRNDAFSFWKPIIWPFVLMYALRMFMGGRPATAVADYTVPAPRGPSLAG